MEKKIRSGMFVEADYIIRKEKLLVRLLMSGKKFYYLYAEHRPYFYLDAKEEEIPELEKVRVSFRGETIAPGGFEVVERNIEGKRRKVLKVYAKLPMHVPAIRAAFVGRKAWEYDIPFGIRYQMDMGLVPFYKVKYERVGRRLLRILGQKQAKANLRLMSFDIETYNPHGAPRQGIDPIIMLSYACGKAGEKPERAGVFSWKGAGREFVQKCKDEKEVLEKFSELLAKEDVQVLSGYNSTNFDLPYIESRARKTGAKIAFGRGGEPFRIKRAGMMNIAKMPGRIYIDLYPALRFLSFIGAVKIGKFTLKGAYSEMFGKKSKEIERLEIWQMWDDEKKREELAEYSLADAMATYEIAQKVLPMEIEMSKATAMPINDVVAATASKLVESLLMHEAARRGHLLPNRPSQQEAKSRMLDPIQGAYVKMPKPGIYEGMVVFDFRGLYPSIIVSHNIDPFMVDCDCCTKEESFVSPTGTRFCKKRRGLIPDVLAKVIHTRAKLKDELKGLQRGTPQYEALFARVQSLKILANSYYGYLAFARSRYYSRKAAESVTAWGRHYIVKMGEKAEQAGFKLLYQDTDSLFLLLGKKSREDAVKFMKDVNSSLPGDMELELEAFYPRGVFVSKKAAGGKGAGAKKKYALLAEDGRIKIRGFELVRRDWSVVARETQRKVLEAILKDGSKEKAIKIVKDVVEKVREGKMPLDKFIIQTQLKKDPKNYDIKSPELLAAKKANAGGGIRGERLGAGAVISYVITKRGGANISDRAVMAEFAKDYDPKYYIEHQILPAVLRILKELGISEDDLKLKGRQQGLGSFM